MADYTDNNGSTYINRNVCRSFNTPLTTSLSALANQVCSEVVILNRTGQDVKIYDSGYSDAANAFLLKDGDTFTFRGVTNSMQLSAATSTGAGSIYYRTQYYSSSVQ